MPNKEDLNYKKRLDDAIASVGSGLATVGRKLTTPLVGKPYTDEELIAKPGRIGSPEHVLGMATSPLDVIQNAVPLLKAAGLTKAAVMLPILRGNKALQAERLAKLKFPGPANSYANETLEHYKSKYPRLMAHQEPPIFELEDPRVSGSMFTGVANPHNPADLSPNALPVIDPFRGPTQFRARMALNPALEHAPREVQMQVQGHELAHSAQALSNKFGTPKYQGLPYPQAYDAFEDAYGYERVPFEKWANRTGTSQLIKDTLGDRWKNIPEKDRQGFVRWIDENPAMPQLRSDTELASTVFNRPDYTKIGADSLRKSVEDAYDFYLKNIKNTGLSRKSGPIKR